MLNKYLILIINLQIYKKKKTWQNKFGTAHPMTNTTHLCTAPACINTLPLKKSIPSKIAPFTPPIF